MKLTKKIKIKRKYDTIEITIKKEGDAQYDSEKFKKNFNDIINDLYIMFMEQGVHVENIKSS